MKKITPLGQLLGLFLFLIGQFTFATDFGNKTVTQYEPYLEWSVNNNSYSGNAYDVIATVTFTHSNGTTHTTEMFYDGGSTWKFRFSGSLTGNWSFTTSSSDGDLNGHTGTVTVNTNNDNDIKGYITESGPFELKKWTWSKDNLAFVPNYVMYGQPQQFYNNSGKINNDINNFVDGHGFTGFHVPQVAGRWFDVNKSNDEVSNSAQNPDGRTFDALEDLITRTYKAGGAVHFWVWGDAARSQTMNSHPSGKLGTVEKRLLRYMAARLGALPGWSVGYGFDLGEWTNANEVDEFEEYLKDRIGWFHYISGRYQGPKGGTNHGGGRTWNEKLSYAAWEHHKPSQTALTNAANEVKGKPLFSEDRFRIRNENRSKDFKFDGSDSRQYMYRLLVGGGFAGIWGNVWQVDQNRGSITYQNKEELKKFARFFYEDEWRFDASFTIANNLSNTSGSYVMKSSDNKKYLIYAEGKNSVNINLSGASGNLKAVAMNTVGNSYSIEDLGNLSKNNQNISLSSNF